MSDKETSGPDILVTGLGATTPLGGDIATTWAALLAGESGIRELEVPWVEDLPVRIAGALRKNPEDDIDRVQRRRLDRNQQVALIAAREAWADAGAPEVAPDRLAVVIGTGIGGVLTTLDQYDTMAEGGSRRVSPYTVPRLMPNGAAAVVSIELGAQAGAHTPTSACASGAEAIAVAASLIRTGRADVVVTGGVDACLHPLMIAGFARIGSLSTRNDVPEAASRPFDQDRDGFVMAEGAGMLVLERADFARARGARVRARYGGAGITSDAYGITSPAAEGQIRAIRSALRDAGVAATDIGHVNAHATGTPTGDVTEASAIKETVSDAALVTSTKASTGHLIGAAGAVEAIFTVLALQEGVVPPNRNLENPAPEIELDLVDGSSRAARLDAALSTSFGFGGHNVALVFTRH
ncbi:beta-ketoacyl-[acyl-carrier-protein] synthase family protein [Streptomyces ipomoeae]|uniref:beta-ketoacyl-[acyl-carrier-protein] synthase family protein n=1 Tax=Streptomyces ipomoeae TaxID=103232 RepID=UPI0011470420|nr:beta-ketoacyl-[acyl-carrier-protein] synthase family protein [Streptomyces ipomoeae]MDX2939105.1 beta-ketoacyl-[acyl-carrier-protein] synthase family protein [Streptomyces ipomoeae]TQE30895.1 beta-ketoacyl-[acyl-carrier-protein] synthase family protein [Streptomyces ipomoeae]